jgi:hypothetical protein
MKKFYILPFFTISALFGFDLCSNFRQSRKLGLQQTAHAALYFIYAQILSEAQD